ncbi:NADH:flavin oxidoreductase [Aquisediminimonas sediminicola]|uniref:NADH:flavin oxidoreductase n=1 Tax=Alteraquisediminimonas sediminicola TaxID=2676787 RepID=UPI001C8D72A9|nr:NADH:flavin oxidoreductase [Aquisediminimonas sediminicola]
MTSLNAPLTFVHGPEIKNRFMLSPLTNLQSNDDGTLGEDELNFLVKRAEGGFGLVMTCAASVHMSGKAFKGQLGCYADDHIPGLKRIATALRAVGALSSVQLHHAGGRADAALNGGQLYGPWDDEQRGIKAMTTAQVEDTIQHFINAAIRCEKAGFDGVELHGAHGYLLCQFLDERHNNRTDRFGGSYENRTRIYHEVIEGVRAATGPDFQLGIRLSAERYGYSIAIARQFAQELMTGGKLDYIDMSLWDSFKLPEEEAYKSKMLIDWFTDLDRSHCRLGVAGKLLSAKDVQACLDHGADFVLIGRGAILHHDFPQQILANPDFVSQSFPVTPAYLAHEAVGTAFIQYLATAWENYVVKPPVPRD